MGFSKDMVSDVIAVLTVMRKEFERTSNNCDFTELRRKTVKDVAETEFNKGRYEHEDSAKKTIHDACARRLKHSIADFDRLTEQWLCNNSMQLKDILLEHSKSRSQCAEVTSFFKTGSHEQ